MSRKSATISLAGNGLQLTATTGSGHQMVLDDAMGDAGPRPAELVPVALAACTAMDVISILRKKHQDVASYTVECSGVQRDDESPHIFMSFEVTHVIEGPDVSEEAVRRSIELSATRYCSVGGTLGSGTATIRHGYVVRSSQGELRGDVIELGPNGQMQLLDRRELLAIS
jgi:putative redox protein